MISGEVDRGRGQVRFWVLGVQRDGHKQEHVQKWRRADRPLGMSRSMGSPERARWAAAHPEGQKGQGGGWGAREAARCPGPGGVHRAVPRGPKGGWKVGRNAGETISQPGLGEERLAAPGAVRGWGGSHVCSCLLPWGWTCRPLPTEVPDGKPSVLRGPPGQWAPGRGRSCQRSQTLGEPPRRGARLSVAGGCPPRSVSG